MFLWIRLHWRPLLALALLVGLPLLLLGTIADDLRDNQPFTWESPLMVSLRADAPTWFAGVARAFSTIGSAKIMLPFCALLTLWFWTRSHVVARYFLLSVSGAVILNVLLKLFFARTRPQVIPWLWQEGDSSFPSGHSSMAAALAVTVVALLWRTPYRWPSAVLGVIYTLVMGLSRVYLGVHYPTDVLGGWALGLAWAGGVATLLWKRLREAQESGKHPLHGQEHTG
jgi:membrane-associated phospholipid phosphatase